MSAFINLNSSNLGWTLKTDQWCSTAIANLFAESTAPARHLCLHLSETVDLSSLLLELQIFRLTQITVTRAHKVAKNH